MGDFIIIYTTCKDEKEAASIATALTEERIAGCVQITPDIKSVYRWQGEVISDKEVLLSVKTLKSAFKRVEERITALHSYTTPEIIAVDITDGSSGYLEWLRNEVKVF